MIKKLHFVGIGGSGISGVARLAKKMGYKVSGCDLEKSTAYGKDILRGHNPKHIKDADLVVASPALFYKKEENSEIVEARRQKKLITWQGFTDKYLTKGKKVICIAGTHGKSTTTAMVGKLLTDAGLDPTVLVGANVPEWNGNSRFGKGKYFVIEADEFNNNFLNYHPDIILLTNIEFDHPDFFRNEKDVKKSFDTFIKSLKGEKILITSKDSYHKHFNLKVFGEHNQKNANMVYVLGKILGISERAIVESIENFKGIGRRMELIADKNGIKVYDDYAHHPTAIKTTLEGLREKYPKAKILAVVEPHGYKRTKALLSSYKNIFDSVDRVFVGPIFKARDEVDKTITSQKITEASNHKNILGFDSFRELFRSLELEIRNCDYSVIVVMGAGKSYLWAKEIANFLPVNFSDLTTFKVGGKIKKYFEVKNKEEIKAVVDYAKENRFPIFILGGGSDILVNDKDFEGVVVKYIADSYQIRGDYITAEAGMIWDELVKVSVDEGLGGLESLSGIPGTVGGAPIQNVGAYGAELSDHFFELKAYDLKKRKVVTFTKSMCKFGYRESVFKSKDYWQRFLIMDVTLKLKKGGKSEVGYESLKKAIGGSATISEIRNAVLKIRADKLEDPSEFGNAGSFFKNPVIDAKQKKQLLEENPGAKIFPFGNKFKISAAWLIEKAGWKGKVVGNVAVSPKHALILINKTGEARAEEVFGLSEKIIDDVQKKFDIGLEREVQLINFK